MNTYAKYTANVFVAKCDQEYQKGDVIPVTTKYGKENECIVFNLVFQKDGCFYYSIVRADGFNSQEWAKNRAEKLINSAAMAEKKSNEYHEASNEGRDFLSLGEPIKIGHHSEKRHRALIDRNWNRMGKSVEFSKIAKGYESRAEYWESRANDINLSLPESVDYFQFRLDQAKQRHELLKAKPELRGHSYSLTYAKKEVNELEAKVKTAEKLWGNNHE